MPCAGSRWPAAARGPHAPTPSPCQQLQLGRPPACRCRPQPSTPTHAGLAASGRSSRQSIPPLPGVMDNPARDPASSGSLARVTPAQTCTSSCSYRLHLLRMWSLRQTRRGSWRGSTPHRGGSCHHKSTQKPATDGSGSHFSLSAPAISNPLRQSRPAIQSLHPWHALQPAAIDSEIDPFGNPPREPASQRAGITMIS